VHEYAGDNQEFSEASNRAMALVPLLIDTYQRFSQYADEYFTGWRRAGLSVAGAYSGNSDHSLRFYPITCISNARVAILAPRMIGITHFAHDLSHGLAFQCQLVTVV